MKKGLIILLAALAIVIAGYVGYTIVGSKAAVVSAGASPTYEGTVYISSMGGFLVKADLKIDPSKEEPIGIVGPLQRVFLMEKQDIAVSKKYYATHYADVDTARGEIFWAAYFIDDRDPAKKGVRYGKVDLKTGKVLFDGMLPHEPRNIAPIQYCGGAQTKDKMLYVMMGFETFIDIVDKETMKHERRVFLDEAIPTFKEKRYLWTHITNMPGMREELVLVTSLSDEGGKFPRGEETRQKVFVLDMKELLKGKVKVLRETTVTSDPKKSAFFRGSYTPDGKYILL